MNSDIKMMDGDFPSDTRLKIISWTAAFLAGAVFWLLVFKLISCTLLA